MLYVSITWQFSNRFEDTCNTDENDWGRTYVLNLI